MYEISILQEIIKKILFDEVEFALIIICMTLKINEKYLEKQKITYKLMNDVNLKKIGTIDSRKIYIYFHFTSRNPYSILLITF